jgi:transposase-like protein
MLILLSLRWVKGNEQKKCFYCGSKIIKKNGFVLGVQRYKCHVCGRQFVGGARLDNRVLWQEYTKCKQTYSQLADKYGCSAKTIGRRLDKVEVASGNLEPTEVVVLMDTTYFGRIFGVMLFKNALDGENLYKQYVKYETNKLYAENVEKLKERGFIIKAIVCDGRKGLFRLFENLPIQMCQFHQTAIITRYLTRNPKTLAAQELRELSLTLAKADKESFVSSLTNWFDKWQSFLNERTTNPETKKSFYTHKRLRSAYRSLRTNLPWLFTFSDHPHLNIPNTTNSIDGHFADLKNKLRNHNGLSIERKKKFIDEFLKA